MTATTDYDRVDFWITELERLDRIMEKPARSLIEVARAASEKGLEVGGRKVRTIPTMFDASDRPVSESPLIHAVACSAIQRLTNQRRRFSFLKSERKTLEPMSRKLVTSLLEHPALESKDPLETLRALDDPAFGMLNPLLCSEVFWLLVRAGENYAHGDLGFLALFGMLWALERRLHGPFAVGAAVGQWRPTVAVTARCLLPIFSLLNIVENRAKLWEQARDVCISLDKDAPGRNQWQRWRFAAELDHLSGILHQLAEISIKAEDFHHAAERLTELASPLTPSSNTAPLGAKVRQIMRDLLKALRDQNEAVLRKAEHATHVVQQGVLDILGTDDARRAKLFRDMNLIPVWEPQLDAAKRANAVCVAALRELQSAVALCDKLPQGTSFTHDVLIGALSELSAINRRVHRILSDAIRDNVEWCVHGMNQEIAFASAKNDTEFDAAELLSGVLVGERMKRVSPLEAGHAVGLSLRAAREDGSWWSGQPVFLEKRVLGVWPSTPDVMLLLATAVKQFDTVDCADAHLSRFIDWLEIRALPQKPRWWNGDELWGWSSEAREPEIDVWATATAVKALLEVREIIEDRLWTICQRRFTVVPSLRKLTEIDPVDLGATHQERLQTAMLRNAAKVQLDKDDAEYSYMLHGPPGSSKSVLGQAIGKEMWSDREAGRFVRITPADFTRSGESGIDFEARFIFRLLSHLRQVTIFFDEIDDFLRVREIGAEPAFIRLVIPGMLNRLQDLRDSARAQEICFLLGTNYIDQIEPALIRPGRIDQAVPVPYPDAWSRHAILEKRAGTMPAALAEHIVDRTAEWPWTTYDKLCTRLNPKISEAKADELIAQLSLEFQPPDYYYLNALRWKASSPLDSELVHVAFATSKQKAKCRQRVQKLIAKLEGKQDVRIAEFDLLGKFDTEWRREGRS